MRRKQYLRGVDDADAGAGVPSPPQSNMTSHTSHSEIEFFDEVGPEPVLVLGVDISHMNRNMQFWICASGVFFFSLLYGFLQELISVKICSRQLGLFLATVQFVGYTALAAILRNFVLDSQLKKQLQQQRQQNSMTTTSRNSNPSLASSSSSPIIKTATAAATVPFQLYLGLSLLRAVDLAMTNLAMQYINYPAKTLMKSSRVVFTMIFGVLLAKKVYQVMDYMIVICMVTGLVIFMHADAHTSAIFQPAGVIMLTISLICDGAISNMSETIMNSYGVGQDEFIFRMYSIALIAISGAATVKGDMMQGIIFMLHPGTYAEHLSDVPMEERSWSSFSKFLVMLLFSSMGFFGSSCSAAITKNFGALTMSITSTTRKAGTLFLSFVIFKNECTFEHIGGMIVFISALLAKSFRRKNKSRKGITSPIPSATTDKSNPYSLDRLESGKMFVQISNSFDGVDVASGIHPTTISTVESERLLTSSTTTARPTRVSRQSSAKSSSPTRRTTGRHYVL